MNRLSLLILGSWSLLIVSCVGIEPKPPLSTVASVDLTRYTGRWYEIARLPMWFQRHCIASQATYTLLPNHSIAVHNECLTDSNDTAQADGIATVVDPQTNAKLSVRFDNFFAKLIGQPREGNYWILDLDPAYQTALVGTPDRRYLWILSRTPQLDDALYQQFVATAQQLGFPVSDLIKAAPRQAR
ncbi:MAG: lipocalin family protein [Nitrospira sp.]|nr:lipocalin family protein [Nitrospira sp.]MDH4305797.1 lipocalin family protein [Nitrospira sp.]MDH5193553.1 lipocalin family protein [Nitrospira sp.]